ncbi:N-6 DNA methylase, partial [Vibrio cholerae]|uniref:N-6 DNA methylase n=1 Tax=Vibrio cholerae TaxID=666 RepID=UPI0020CC81DC
QKFDFYATIFEYLIKDYNSNSGGKYAEYYTPHAVARIMAKEFWPAVEKGFKSMMDTGTLAGFPVLDVEVELFDGGFH